MGTESNLIICDLETTGLRSQIERIIEIALLPVNANLEPLDVGWSTVVKLEYYNPAWMNKTVREMHTKNGLLADLEAGKGVDILDVTHSALQYCERFGVRGQLPLCGSSIHFDRKFLEKYMPSLDNWFHYRNADISSLKELWKRWFPEAGVPPKEKAHRALDDCYATLEEAKWYKQRLRVVI